MNKLLTCIIVGAFLSSCNPVQINHVSQVKKFNKPTYIFALPQTALTVTLTIEKQIVKKGPYAEFAEKYIGITNVPKESSEKFLIKNIEISNHSIADTEQIFVIQYKHKLPWNSVIQQNDGIILAINQKNINLPVTRHNNHNYINPSLEHIAFKELSQSSYFKEKIDTIFKQVKVDTNWVRIAVPKKSIDTLKLEDKAKEAAQHIFDIRSRLFDLLTGDIETLPQGEAAKTIVEYLKSEEQEYLSLFLGKTYTTTIHFDFEVIPKLNNNKYILAYFDPNKGIVNTPSKNTKTISIILNTYDSFKPFTLAQLKYQKAQKKNTFPYLMPVLTKVSVMLNDEIVFTKDIPIYQFGKTMEVPICFLKKYAFDFTNPQIITISK
ncbi:MAG: DUF4831 family protein [Bacteroidales bacterium]